MGVVCCCAGLLSLKFGNLLPGMFKCGSDHKMWWKCPKCGFEYQSTISHRTNKKKTTGCPICAKERCDFAKCVAVNMINIKTNKIVKTFVSISEAGQKMKINPANIGSVCKGQRTKAGGYGWKYADEKRAKKYKGVKKQLLFDFN